MGNYIASIDLGGTHLRTALFSTEGKIVAQSKIKTEVNSGVSGVLKRIQSAVFDTAKTISVAPHDIIALGIGVPGPVDSARGLVYNCPNMPGWHNIFVKKEVESLLDIPVFVENDARVAALGELQCGAGQNIKHFFYVTIGTGIGGAIIIDGKLYRGADGAAGEFGMTRTLGGDIFEGYASGPAIYQKFGIYPSDIPSLIEKNDKNAQKALAFLVNNLGTWLGNIATLLNPHKIIVGGGLAELGDELLISPLEEKVKQTAFSISGAMISVEKAMLGDDAGLYGAAKLTGSLFRS